MTVRGRITRALAVALKDATLHPRDGGAVALLKRYAQLMDEAQALADEAELIEPETDDQVRRLNALRLRVEAQTVVSDLGPKFLAALTALGMTVAGRATNKTTKGGGSESGNGRDAFDELRARRNTRADRAKAVHTSAP